MATAKLIMNCDVSELVAACTALNRYSELFGDAAQKRIEAFIGSFNSPTEMFTVNQDSTSTEGAQNFFFVIKPVDRFLEFLAAMAVDFDINVEQGFHNVHIAPPDNIFPECTTASEVNQNEY